MISAAVVSSFRVLRMRPAGRSSVSPGSPLHQRHDGDAGLEAREPERQLREDEQRRPRPSSAGCRSWLVSAARQSEQARGCVAISYSPTPMTTAFSAR